VDLGLKDKTVFIAGASRGIGLGIAEACLREGARVAITARSEAPLHASAAGLISEFGEDRIWWRSADMRDTDAIEQALAAAEASLRKKTSPATIGKSRTAVAEQAPRVGETILLVEDEAALRALAKKILSHHGYRVLDAADGAIALRLAAGHVGEIDLVLTDVAMPNLGGRGMVEELRELSQDTRVLFMSGYPKEEVFPDKEVAKVTAYIQKPFTRETLLTEVRAALGYAR
jgi:CheY-like chemotaxis protein